MKKSMKVLTVGALALGFAAGCSTEGQSQLSTSLSSAQDVYAFSALSTTNLLTSVAATSAPLAASLNQEATTITLRNDRGGLGGFIDRMMGRRSEITLTEEELTEVNRYVGVFESLLSDSDPIVSEVVDSDDANYTYKMTISTKTIDNTSLVYTMYYNEVVVEGEEVSSVSTDLEGIMIIDDTIYDVVGHKVVNDNHSLVTFTSMIDDQNYVRITESVVNNRSQFTYKVVSEGVVVSEAKIRFAKVNNVETIFLETLSEGNQESYRFTKVVNETETYIHMMIGSGINKTAVLIKIEKDPTTNEDVYSYYAGGNMLGRMNRMIKNKFGGRR